MEDADEEDLRSSLEEFDPRVVKEEKLGFTPGRDDAAHASAPAAQRALSGVPRITGDRIGL